MNPYTTWWWISLESGRGGLALNPFRQHLQCCFRLIHWNKMTRFVHLQETQTSIAFLQPNLHSIHLKWNIRSRPESAPTRPLHAVNPSRVSCTFPFIIPFNHNNVCIWSNLHLCRLKKAFLKRHTKKVLQKHTSSDGIWKRKRTQPVANEIIFPCIYKHLDSIL